MKKVYRDTVDSVVFLEIRQDSEEHFEACILLVRNILIDK